MTQEFLVFLAISDRLSGCPLLDLCDLLVRTAARILPKGASPTLQYTALGINIRAFYVLIWILSGPYIYVES